METDERFTGEPLLYPAAGDALRRLRGAVLMKPTKPGPNDSFIMRNKGKVFCCEDCGINLFHELPPRNGINRYGCNGCGAAYFARGGGPPKLLEN